MATKLGFYTDIEVGNEGLGLCVEEMRPKPLLEAVKRGMIYHQ